MEHISTTHPRASINHKCDFCLDIIPAKTVYVKSTYKYDGIYTWKSHNECSVLVTKLNMIEHCDESVTADDFLEFTKEWFDRRPFVIKKKTHFEQIKQILENKE
tara:strand:- start:3622 stop:3933 length:312 start_codon:yes stop_codon:yes gene_type:complete